VEGAGGLSRREFLAGTGWVAAGSTVLASCSWLPPLPTFAAPDADDALLWVQALPDGRIRFLCPKSEMGQGITTGLAQVVAEELNVAAEAIEVVLPESGAIAPCRLTAGSLSVRDTFEPLSHAAAVLRETLRGRAAERAGLAPAAVRDAEGGFLLPDGSRVGHAEVAGDSPSLIEADPAHAGEGLRRYAMERRGAHRQIGRRARRVGIEAIVTGSEVYSRDVVVPGMVYGRVLHAPRLGATPARVNATAVRARPGVLAALVHERRGWVGVVAEDPFALERAVAQLEVEWRGGEHCGQAELDRELDVEREDFEHTLVSDGDPLRAESGAVHRLEAHYDTSIMAHAAMEPRAGVASVTPQGVEVWTASQDLWYMRGLVARITGRREGEVRVHNHRMGGAFGGRKRCQATEEAAWLSAAVGRPVRVQWTREDEFRGNFFMPPFSHHIHAGVDANGLISHWRHDFTAGPIILSSDVIPKSLHWLADLPGDPGTTRGAVPPYAIAHRRIRYSDIRLPVSTGTWRGLGAAPNTTAIEIAVDELAQLAGADPIEFRLRNLPPEQGRLARVLRKAAALADWGAPPPPGRGRGVACALYQETTHVAVVMEVAIDPGDGTVRPTRSWCAHDCGLVINPDHVEAQIEGNVAWGCSMALHERVTLADGHVREDNFDTYPILRQLEAPEVEIALVEGTGDPPVGVGEPTIAPVAAALVNAVFAASGARVRRLPVGPVGVLGPRGVV
jgi:CO/xanthine dehydrogenase Mo-binding subunit